MKKNKKIIIIDKIKKNVLGRNLYTDIIIYKDMAHPKLLFHFAKK